ncbi:hypothetical protein [Streptomyces sp. NPDC006551]|uniref:hypothetical protein n=1 Tax=Streptomyces sp. NPDC006551 TaxID=3157178 RepID=UPI0033B02A36
MRQRCQLQHQPGDISVMHVCQDNHRAARITNQRRHQFSRGTRHNADLVGN